MTARAECAFQLAFQSEFPCGWVLFCLPQPCENDLDCYQIHTYLDAGRRCVAGNCVFCWNDEQCPEGLLCRGGQCLRPDQGSCPYLLPWPECSNSGCNLVRTSEDMCSACLCDTLFRLPCTSDLECLAISHYPYSRCVYGRCAECRKDLDCPGGQTCIPPGICFTMQPHPEALYGAWLIGWGGGMDHFSYFRFEPDGTFRRGRYVNEGAWSDDIGPSSVPCHPSPPDGMTFGTWSPLYTASSLLGVFVTLNLYCDQGAGATARWLFSVSADGDTATVTDLDVENLTYEAYRVDMDACDPSFTSCEVPGGYPP